MAQNLILPINKTRITAGYKNVNYKNQFGFNHYGSDSTSTNSDRTVWGSGVGQVLEAGFDNVLGNVVVIRYNNCQLKNGTTKDLIQRLYHLDRIDVVKGQSITKDTRVGLYGNTGKYTTGAHLHVEFDTDVNYPTYSPTLSSSSNIIKAGTDSTLNPAQVMYVKNSAPDYQSVVGASNSNCWLSSDVSYPKYDGSAPDGEIGALYYPKPNYSGTSLVEALKSIGVDSGFDNREKIAAANGITNYTGTATQNDSLFNLLMSGQLRRPDSVAISYYPVPNYTGTSLVGALNVIGVDSSFDNREKIAAVNGITDYTGTAAQNDLLFNLLMSGRLICPDNNQGGGDLDGGGTGSAYFPTPSYSGTSLVGALNAIGVDSSFDNREKIAAANGITNYTGSVDQNNKLFNLLMTGQLKRPGSMDSDNGSGDTGDGLTEIGHVSGLKVRKILPPTNKYDIKCPYPMDPTYITVHNTANQASAINEISYMHNNSNEVSFHYAVDDIEAIQGLPLNRNGWHSGDGSQGTGNRKSIAVEICYSRYGGEKFDKAEKNAAKLIAALMEQFDIPIDRVRKHQDWSGKYCPHRTLDAGWDRFVDMIMQEVRYRQILKFASENGLFTGTNVALEDFNKRVKLLEIPGTVPGRPNLIVYGEVGLHSTISFIDITGYLNLSQGADGLAADITTLLGQSEINFDIDTERLAVTLSEINMGLFASDSIKVSLKVTNQDINIVAETEESYTTDDITTTIYQRLIITVHPDIKQPGLLYIPVADPDINVSETVEGVHYMNYSPLIVLTSGLVLVAISKGIGKIPPIVQIVKSILSFPLRMIFSKASIDKDNKKE